MPNFFAVLRTVALLSKIYSASCMVLSSICAFTEEHPPLLKKVQRFFFLLICLGVCFRSSLCLAKWRMDGGLKTCPKCLYKSICAICDLITGKQERICNWQIEFHISKKCETILVLAKKYRLKPSRHFS